MASVATLFLLSSNQAKAHAVKKFPWLRWLRDNKVEEAHIELEEVKEIEVEEAGLEEVTGEEDDPEEELVEELNQAPGEIVEIQEA